MIDMIEVVCLGFYYLSVWVWVSECTCVHAWRPEEGIRCLFTFHLFRDAKSDPEPGPGVFSWLG